MVAIGKGVGTKETLLIESGWTVCIDELYKRAVHRDRRNSRVCVQFTKPFDARSLEREGDIGGSIGRGMQSAVDSFGELLETKGFVVRDDRRRVVDQGVT